MQLNAAPFRRTPSARSGFTLIELLVVIAIIAILIGILAIGFGALNRAARETAVAQDLAALKNAVTQFKTEFGFLPPLVRDEPANTRLDRSGNPPSIAVWDPVNRDRAAAAEARQFLSDGPTNLAGFYDPDPRFSEYSLAYYIVGALDAEIDGVEGVGFRRPRADGTFETRGREYQPFFDLGSGGSSAIVQRGTDLTQGDVVLVDRYGTPYRYYRWLPPESFSSVYNPYLLHIPPLLILSISGQEPGTPFPAPDPENLSERITLDLLSASFAIVSAGPSGVFGDEDDDTLRRALRQPMGVSRVTLQRLAAQDNIVELGR